MDECCGDNNASAEIPSEKVDVEGNSKPFNSFRQDRKESRCGGAYHDDKERRDSCSQLAIILVTGRLNGTIDIMGIGGVEVNVASIEGCISSIDSRHDLGFFYVTSRDGNAGKSILGFRELCDLSGFDF